jgi:hypothetical protein
VILLSSIRSGQASYSRARCREGARRGAIPTFRATAETVPKNCVRPSYATVSHLPDSSFERTSVLRGLSSCIALIFRKVDRFLRLDRLRFRDNMLDRS